MHERFGDLTARGHGSGPFELQSWVPIDGLQRSYNFDSTPLPVNTGCASHTRANAVSFRHTAITFATSSTAYQREPRSASVQPNLGNAWPRTATERRRGQRSRRGVGSS